MTPARLDRLSALLEGLNPKVTLGHAADGFSLHIIHTGPETMGAIGVSDQHINTLGLLACPPGQQASSALENGERCFMSFDVAFEGPLGPSFLAEFSRPIRIGMADADPSLLQVVTLIANEMQARRCGQPLFINRAGDILLIGLMRHLTSRPQQPTGLFTALADPRIARSLVAMHTTPAHPWTLETLADLAGMSRTSFATSFKHLMQVPPGKYLENLRLATARQLLQSGSGLKKTAAQTGYASASTLSRALGRHA